LISFSGTIGRDAPFIVQRNHHFYLPAASSNGFAGDCGGVRFA
jgi:hypothetical protein